MRDFPIPVVPFSHSSHDEAEQAEYMTMPQGMETFSMPGYQHEGDPEVLSGACAVLERLRNDMRQNTVYGCVHAELTGLQPQVVELINQCLGQGEVSILVAGPMRLRIQETVFAGIWREQQISEQGLLLRDSILACDVPPAVRQSAMLGAGEEIEIPEPRPGLMNAPAILNELLDKSRSHRAGQAAHVVNLSLLPVTTEDQEYLMEALGAGPVTMLSRGYGNCRITGTDLANVWWVQYFNSMDQIILSTIEVVDIPEAALAAAEDYADSTERLTEWLAVMREDLPDE